MSEGQNQLFGSCFAETFEKVEEKGKEKQEKRRTYYVEYYKKNRDRLLEYQHNYNQSHNIITKPKQCVAKKFGKLAVTRANITKRLEMNARRVAEFKTQLQEQIAGSNPVASLPLS